MEQTAVGGFGSGDEPPSEERSAAITEAIASGAEDKPEYALAKEYLDALAEYVGILNYEMDFTAAESTEFVMNKYITPSPKARTPISQCSLPQV